jgi:hypothetical protein
MPATSYPRIREHLNSDYARLPDQKIESILGRQNIDAESLEGFFDDLGKVASSVGKAVVSAAPAVLPVAGRVVGTMFGGPVGGAIGGSLGSLAGGAIGAATGQRPSAPGLLSQIPGVGGILGSPAAGQLLQTVLRPETMQALMSMALGPMGRPNVPVGPARTPVPLGAFSNLLGILANQASEQYQASVSAARGAVPDYMLDYAGEAKGDPAVAENRAEALWELLQQSQAEQESPESPESPEAADYELFQSEMEAANQEWDAIELIEMYGSSEDY